MKKIVKHVKRLPLTIHVCFAIYGIIFFLFSSMVLLTGIKYKNSENLVFTNIVTNIYTLSDYDKKTFIELKDTEYRFKINDSDYQHVSNLIEIGDEITIVTYEKTFRNKHLVVFQIIKDENILLDVQEKHFTTDFKVFNWLFIVTVILFIVSLIFLRLYKKPKIVNYDYIDYTIRNINYQSFKPNYKITQQIKGLIAIGIYIITLIPLLIVLGIASEKYEDIGYIYKYVGISIFVLSTIIMFLYAMSIPYKKRVKIYLNDYLNYLNGIGSTVFNSYIQISKVGIKYLSYDDFECEDNYDYDDFGEESLEGLFPKKDLNLYTVVKISNNYNYVNIFICSNLPEQYNNEYTCDFVIPLTFEVLKELKENEYDVKNLEYVLDNLQNIVEKNTRLFKTVIISNFNNNDYSIN